MIKENSTIVSLSPFPSITHVQSEVDKVVESVPSDSVAIYNDEEQQAQETLCSALERHSFQPTRRAHGLDTGFESHTTNGKGFGTPAEELGGGKIRLSKAGAFKNVDISLMAHEHTEPNDESVLYPGGIAGVRLTAKQGFDGPFTGTYNIVSMLRQQMHPSYRVHSTIVDAPKVANIISQRTNATCSVRAVALGEAVVLPDKVEKCIESGASATECNCSADWEEPYAEMRLIQFFWETYTVYMKPFGEEVRVTAKKFWVTVRIQATSRERWRRFILYSECCSKKLYP
ncbi:Peptidase M20 [Venturia nashicola]|nr:Peptidase M20 [Venturia nashicola]